jgi:hypothetical protein
MLLLESQLIAVNLVGETKNEKSVALFPAGKFDP